MKKINYTSLIFTLLLTLAAFSGTSAQETEEPKPNQAARPFKLMQELGLTTEQIQQIRRINQMRRPIVQEAQARWREANANLDAAVYADEVSEEQIKELTKTAQMAQAELLKERTITEYLIRKVLTTEQLVKFRELRDRLRRVSERKNAAAQDNSNVQPQRQINRFQRRNRARQP